MANVPLTPELIVWAYRQGIFPMGGEDDEIEWFRPDPRAVIPIDGFRASRSLRRSAQRYDITFDTAYEQVMRRCARDDETWITEDFIRVYTELYASGRGHSAEAWLSGDLVGGVYGIALGKAFIAESMFHSATDAGKAALWKLIEKLQAEGYLLFDVQYLTPHLASLGAVEIPLSQYLEILQRCLE